MKNLLTSVAALLASFFGLALVLWIGEHDIVPKIEARVIARIIEFFLPLFGLQGSVVVKSADVSISCSLVTLTFALLSIFCFRCVVREWSLRYAKRTA